MNEAPAFDRFDFLRRISNNEELMRDILVSFLEETPKRLEEIRRAVNDRDMKESRRLTHTLKGSAANVSAIALRDIAAAMHEASKSEDIEGLKKGFLDLGLQFERFRAVAAKEVGSENS